MIETDDHDEVFKPLPSIRDIPFMSLRFARPRYLVLGILVWNAAFLLTQDLGGSSVPLGQAPERLLALGLVCLAFAACCSIILFDPTIESTVLARPEERHPFRKDLWMVVFTLLFLGVTSVSDAVRALASQ